MQVLLGGCGRKRPLDNLRKKWKVSDEMDLPYLQGDAWIEFGQLAENLL